MREKEEIAREDESIFPYKILKFRAAEIVDEKTDIEVTKDRIVARLMEQIKPYVVFNASYTHPTRPDDKDELCYPVLIGELLLVATEMEE